MQKIRFVENFVGLFISKDESGKYSLQWWAATVFWAVSWLVLLLLKALFEENEISIHLIFDIALVAAMIVSYVRLLSGVWVLIINLEEFDLIYFAAFLHGGFSWWLGYICADFLNFSSENSTLIFSGIVLVCLLPFIVLESYLIIKKFD